MRRRSKTPEQYDRRTYKPTEALALSEEEIQRQLLARIDNPLIASLHRRLPHHGRYPTLASAIYNAIPAVFWDAIDPRDTLTDPDDIHAFAHWLQLGSRGTEITDVGMIDLPQGSSPMLVQIRKEFHFSPDMGGFATTKLYKIMPIGTDGRMEQDQALLLWVYQANMDEEEVIIPHALPDEFFDRARLSSTATSRNILLIPLEASALAA